MSDKDILSDFLTNFPSPTGMNPPNISIPESSQYCLLSNQDYQQLPYQFRQSLPVLGTYSVDMTNVGGTVNRAQITEDICNHPFPNVVMNTAAQKTDTTPINQHSTPGNQHLSDAGQQSYDRITPLPDTTHRRNLKRSFPDEMDPTRVTLGIVKNRHAHVPPMTSSIPPSHIHPPSRYGRMQQIVSSVDASEKILKQLKICEQLIRFEVGSLTAEYHTLNNG